MSKLNLKLVTLVRKATGAALHTCKRALEEAKGNVEAAIAAVKKMGYALADKKSDRITSEGCIVGQVYEPAASVLRGGLLACQSETDFVSTNELFTQFVKQALDLGLKAGVNSLDELIKLSFDGTQTVEEARQALVAQVGENVRFNRYEILETSHHLGLYVHKGRYGALVALKGSSPLVAKDIAVHIVVNQPKDLAELLEQDFYKDPSKQMGSYLKENSAELVHYIHFTLGND